jgi:beta-galactosidase GanA
MIRVLVFVLSCIGILSAAGPIPEFRKVGEQHQLIVDGRPFLMLGAQVHNSSGWPSELESVWKQALQMHANTLEIPIYWHDIEPQPGQYKFDTIDAIVEGARKNDLRLVLLWFATWKNGNMDYAPDWVKENPVKYPRMLDRAGDPVRVLSPHSQVNMDADRAAFAAVMRHLKQLDEEQRTVIMVQVQNEPGSLFTVRDNSEEANRLFAGQAPSSLTGALGKSSGTWSEAFGAEAEEAFAAWHVARYVNAVAEAGKKEYPLPLTVNVWLKERKEYMLPAENYPSGGAVTNMLDLWKAAAPAIDVIAPDIYVMDYVGYREVCESYRRPDNPLLVPETGGWGQFARYMFYAVGDYGAVGWAPFGFNAGEGDLNERLGNVAANYRLLGPAGEKIAELQAGGKLRAAVEEDQLNNIWLKFDGWESVTYFGAVRPSYGGLYAAGTEKKTGRVLIGQSGENEFWVMGFDGRVTFRPTRGLKDRNAQFVRVEEGHFEDGEWTVDRLWSGDQTFFGLRLPGNGKVLRVRLMSH